VVTDTLTYTQKDYSNPRACTEGYLCAPIPSLILHIYISSKAGNGPGDVVRVKQDGSGDREYEGWCTVYVPPPVGLHLGAGGAIPPKKESCLWVPIPSENIPVLPNRDSGPELTLAEE
jgi:hypothetical protein